MDKKLTIACLGWGSLIWDPRDLPIRGCWFDDGPLLPIEFARESRDGRITLVICDVYVVYRVRALWVLMEESDREAARRALASRESVSKDEIDNSIGFWEASGKSSGAAAQEIAGWAQIKRLDAVVWTSLEVGLRNERGKLPTIDRILDHLRSLPHAQGKLAEEYIRKAPPQIDTDYRRRIAKEFGWFHLGRYDEIRGK